MGKKGRPKLKERARFPAGQIKPEGAGITGTQLHRLRSLGKYPILETQVGRLLFLGEIDELQARVAWKIAEIYGRYDSAIGRRRTTVSPAYEVGRSVSYFPEVSSDEEERIRKAVKQFGHLQAEIALCPRGVRSALEELCIADGVCPAGWLPQVKIALDVLGREMGLRGRKRP